MNNVTNVESLYSTEYKRFLGEEESLWKVNAILPLLDVCGERLREKDEINIMDVGGGAGLILKEVANHLESRKGMKINKIALDVSPELLEIQGSNNPGVMKLLNENIENTSLKDKEIDITLMLDVLEHLRNPTLALKEVSRISKFVIFKVPLEKNLAWQVRELITLGGYRKWSIKTIGHVNIYNYSSLKKDIELYCGEVLLHSFTDARSLSLIHCRESVSFPRWLYYQIARATFKLSPRLCVFLFGDFVVMLVTCHE
ncbi:MAG: class I SAM-dependent methyltransferase [bacterium]